MTPKTGTKTVRSATSPQSDLRTGRRARVGKRPGVPLATPPVIAFGWVLVRARVLVLVRARARVSGVGAGAGVLAQWPSSSPPHRPLVTRTSQPGSWRPMKSKSMNEKHRSISKSIAPCARSSPKQATVIRSMTRGTKPADSIKTRPAAPCVE